MKNYPLKKSKSPTDVALDIISSKSSPTDPLGMYTGLPRDKNDEPTQDVDDL